MCLISGGPAGAMGRPVKGALHHRKILEPLNKGHFGASQCVPCREVVPFLEVKMYQDRVLSWEVVLFREGSFSKVLLYLLRCATKPKVSIN